MIIKCTRQQMKPVHLKSLAQPSKNSPTMEDQSRIRFRNVSLSSQQAPPHSKTIRMEFQRYPPENTAESR
jgi:hypothetical protein